MSNQQPDTSAGQPRERRDESFLEFGVATRSALSEVKRLLADSDLPQSDVEPHFDDFIVARSGDSIVGVVGIERHGRSGLLRSLCVRRDFRRRGIAEQLCALIESHAGNIGISELYLLTTTAERYFAKRGFSECARDVVPTSLRQTQQFYLCARARRCACGAQ